MQITALRPQVGAYGRAEPGKTITVSKEHAARLLAGGNWAEPSEAKKVLAKKRAAAKTEAKD